MINPKAPRMQSLPFEALKCRDEFGARALRQSGPTPVDRIPDQGVTDMRHVNANLVGSARFKLDFDQSMGRKSLVDSIMSDGGFAVGTHRKALAVTAVTSDRKVNGASPGQGPLHQSQILAVNAVGLELLDQDFVGLNRACHHQKSAGILIDAVHDARTWHLVERGVVVKERVLERSVMVARGRMDNQPLRLVDHDEGGILVDDMERNGFRGDLRDHLEGRGQDHFLTAKEFSLGFRSLPIHDDRTRPDPVLDSITGIFRKELA